MKHNNRRFYFVNHGPQRRVAAVLVLASILTGCTAGPTTQPLTEDQKQDEAIKHPDQYKLNMDHDISGGGLGESHGLGNDIDHVLNP